MRTMNQEYDDGGHPCDDEQLFCTQKAAQALMDMKPTLTNINRVAMRNVGCSISMGIEGEEKDNPIIMKDDADENIAPNSRRVSLSVTKKPPKFCRPISNPYIKKGTPRLAISTPASNFLPNETSPSLTGTTGSFASATALNRASASALGTTAQLATPHVPDALAPAPPLVDAAPSVRSADPSCTATLSGTTASFASATALNRASASAVRTTAPFASPPVPNAFAPAPAPVEAAPFVRAADPSSSVRSVHDIVVEQQQYTNQCDVLTDYAMEIEKNKNLYVCPHYYVPPITHFMYSICLVTGRATVMGA